MKKIVDKLIKLNKTISTMESCTGGYVANEITNIEGASLVFMFGAVTYSNDYKIKTGVSSEDINKYSVYSMVVANDMSKTICSYTNSNYGIGITGKLNKSDPNNLSGDDNRVYISIYSKDEDLFYNEEIVVMYSDRCRCKEMVFDKVVEMLHRIIMGGEYEII